MTDIVTTLTITLRHARKLTEAEFKNVIGNVVEHIQAEHGAAIEGFAEVTEIRARATHHDEDGDLLDPIHGPVTDHLSFVCAACAEASHAPHVHVVADDLSDA